jgi:hypothetical protein
VCLLKPASRSIATMMRLIERLSSAIKIFIRSPPLVATS